MKDYILRQRLAEYDAKLDLVYRNFSEYVHLAEKAFYSSVTTSSSEQYDIEFSVGLPLKEKANPVLLEVANAFVYYVKLQNNLVNQIVICKLFVSCLFVSCKNKSTLIFCFLRIKPFFNELIRCWLMPEYFSIIFSVNPARISQSTRIDRASTYFSSCEVRNLSNSMSAISQTAFSAFS